MLEVREVDRQVTWVKNGSCYIKRTVLTERIPIDDVTTCDWCGDPIFSSREGQKFCTSSCRVSYHRSVKSR